jgi:prolipoprotein diacylglyceryltransferase
VAPAAALTADRWLAPRWSADLPLLSFMSAVGVCYALGEGIGRLACISFGCCYGKPVAALPAWAQRLCNPLAFVFAGPTKKAVYEGGCAGQALVPIQAVTAVVFTVIGLTGLALHLANWQRAAFVGTIVATQLWRFASEFLRADFRGVGRISAYQAMALLAMVACVGLALIAPAPPTRPPDVLGGLLALWDPFFILAMQALWLAVFLYTGRSTVTGATISFDVRRERV